MNKLHTLLIFTLLNFVAYGDFIDVSSLVSYDGEVKYYDLDRNIIIARAPTARTDLSCVSVLLDSKQIQPERSYYKIESPVASDILVNVERRTAFVENNEKVNQFLGQVRFSTKDINTLSAIRVIMYHIVDNPVGCELISRILDNIRDKMILFKIEGKDFTCKFPRSGFYCDITIPEIKFDKIEETIRAYTEGIDNSFYGYQYIEADLKFSKLNRPFYVGLVHELIHLMHNLEDKTTGVNGTNELNHDKYGGKDFWGEYDDLYTIWGVFAVMGEKIEYNTVSELTFRIQDNIPIRMFYERMTAIDGFTTLDKYVSEEEEFSFEDDEGEERKIEPLELLKEILTEKIITISV